MMPLDPGLFPRATAWLMQVPGGVRAYPECTSRTDVARLILAEFPDLQSKGVLSSFKNELEHAARTKETLPDAWGVLLRLMLRDRTFPDDGALLGWHLAMSARVFNTPIYRMLMHVLSPSLVLAGAQRRWNAFRTGTNLASDGDKNGAVLTYPQLLYPRLVSQAYGESFRAALTAAKAQDVKIELADHSDTVSRYTLKWR